MTEKIENNNKIEEQASDDENQTKQLKKENNPETTEPTKENDITQQNAKPNLTEADTGTQAPSGNVVANDRSYKKPPTTSNKKDSSLYPKKIYGQQEQQQRYSRFRKKICRFCHEKDLRVDYKKPEIMRKFITDRGKILPRRVTGTCAKHQREIAREIKRARIIALIPYVEK